MGEKTQTIPRTALLTDTATTEYTGDITERNSPELNTALSAGKEGSLFQLKNNGNSTDRKVNPESLVQLISQGALPADENRAKRKVDS